MKITLVSTLLCAAGTVVKGVAMTQKNQLGTGAWPWMDDGTGVFEYDTNPEGKDRVTCTKRGERSDGLFNVLYLRDSEIEDGNHFWNVSFVYDNDEAANRGFDIGVTHDAAIKPGYRVKGMYFNGLNLSDGGGLMAGNYGLHRGGRSGLLQNVMMYVEANKSAKTMKIWFIQDGTPLGLAFDVSIADSPLPLHPAISLRSGGASATIEKVSGRPAPEQLQRPDLEISPDNALLGSWKATPSDNSSLYDFPLRISAARFGGASNYAVSVKVVNQLNMHMSCEKSAADAQEWTCTPGPTMNTLMMGPPEMMKKEESVVKFLSELKNLKIETTSEGDVLVIDGGVLRLVRYTVPFSAVTTNPLQPKETKVVKE